MDALFATVRWVTTLSALGASVFLTNPASAAFKPDHYPNFKVLSEHEKEGVDYRVQVSNPGAPSTIFAIHGGMIEPFTSEIARACAGNTSNLYLFEGIKSKDNSKLHITSENFDEPRALNLASESRQCISIHGFADQDHETICVGGESTEMKMRFLHVSESLARAKIEIHSCTHLPGLSPRNIVNRCRKPGLQLEISSALRAHLKRDPELLQKLSEWVRLTFR